jgi:hypothetical protein
VAISLDLSQMAKAARLILQTIVVIVFDLSSRVISFRAVVLLKRWFFLW